MINNLFSKLQRPGIKNSASAMVGNAVNILVKFVTQRVFIEALGVEYLGLNGILSNVISALNIVELGISTAIIYNLYAPLKKRQYDEVRGLLKFYRKAYYIIALITAVLGVLVMPFLHLIVREPVAGVNMYVAYAIVLATTVTSYLLSYRQSILYATEQGRTITNIQTVANVIIAELQILILMLTENYYIYLVVTPVIQFLRNYILHKIAAKRHPYILEKTKVDLSRAVQKDIFKKMRALFIHKVSTFIIFSTDNIIISAFINVTTVGLYSNYHMIFSAAETILSQALKAIVPTVGNLLVDKNMARNYKAFKKVRRVVFAMAIVSSLGILLLADLVVKLWIGEGYELGWPTLVTLTAVHFQTMMRLSLSVFKEAAGIFHEDRWVPVVESLINIVVSVVLVQVMGLAGVFVGTFLSSLALWCYSYPKYVYKKLFGRSYRQYAVETGMQFLIFAAAVMIVMVIKNIIGV